MKNRRTDTEMREIIEEAKRVMRRRGLNEAAAYLLRYSVPLALINRLIDEMRHRRSGD